MKNPRQAVLGILAALLSTILLMGSLSLALVEGNLRLAVLATPTPTMWIALATDTPARVTPEWTGQPVAVTATAGPPEQPTLTLPIIPLPTQTTLVGASCDYPAGWFAIDVQPGDTLEDLAEQYGTTVQALMSGNCLVTENLIPGMDLYVPAPPPPPTNLPTPRCGPPLGWVYYTVQPGDTLYSLALRYGVTVSQLQNANCLGSSTLIRVGQRLAVPFYLPTRTPSPTPTRLPSATLPPTATPTLLPSATLPSSATPTPPFTFTPTLPPASTSTPTPTSPAAPTATPTPTPTETLAPSPTPTATETPAPTNTSTPTPLPTATTTPTPTDTETTPP